jgi:hypothetical protein
VAYRFPSSTLSVRRPGVAGGIVTRRLGRWQRPEQLGPLVSRCGRAVDRPTSGCERSTTPLPSRFLAPQHPDFQGRDVSGVDAVAAVATLQTALGMFHKDGRP